MSKTKFIKNLLEMNAEANVITKPVRKTGVVDMAMSYNNDSFPKDLKSI